jgi:hypothetical protein
MEFGVAFLAIAIPTGVAVWAAWAEVLRHPAIVALWVIVTVGVLYLLHGPLPTNLHGTPDEQANQLSAFESAHGDGLAMTLGLIVGIFVGLIAGQSTRESRN